MISDLILSLILIIYALIISYLTKNAYKFMVSKKIKKIDAIYYNRKLVHILAGGIIALIVPFFSTPIFPLISGLILTIFTYAAHKKGNRLYWFQTKENFNDVSFCLMWGITVFILWWLIGNPWIAIIPITFMAFGDGITGIVRNIIFKKRIKHPIGNIFMLVLCAPMGYILTLISGLNVLASWVLAAAVIASIVERFEIGFIDDNILITISSSIVIYIGYLISV